MNQILNPESQTRPTIGLLIHAITGAGGYESAVWNGVADAARDRDANLICFPGGMLYPSPTEEPDAQRNAVYDLATADNVDGLIISGALGGFVTPEESESFYDRYHPLPMVSIAQTQEGIPSVLVDNYGGMRSVIVHLTQVHGCRRIAFIRGPEGNEDAERRYRAYTDVLTEYGVLVDPNLVAPGDFTPASGAAAIRLLLDERQAEFEAVMAADDNMALGAMEELGRRGIRVPHDVVVAGFNDAEDARAATPSLTTVQQLSYKLGRQATEMLLALLAGQKVPEQVIVPTRLVVRQSCGCLSPTTVQAAAGLVMEAGTKETFETTSAPQRESILFEMVQAMGSSSSGTITKRAEQILDAFFAELSDEPPDAFLSTLDEVLRQTMMEGGDVTSWQGAISALRRHVLPCLPDNKTLFQAEDLWQQVRVAIGETAQRSQAYRRLRVERQAQTLREISQALITTFDIADLTDVVARELPRLDIPRCYLSLYEGLYEGQRAPAEMSRLVIAYDEHGHIELEADAQVFPSRQLTPGDLLHRGDDPPARRYTMVVEPLYFKGQPLGFALLEAGQREGKVYDMLRGHLSSALQRAILVQDVEDRTRALQEANYAIQSHPDPRPVRLLPRRYLPAG
jgi:DNA-binding LacI/PurR family transcriptional regulator